VKVGDKVTIEYTMTAKNIEEQGSSKMGKNAGAATKSK
jgi:hypothetical protein